MPRGKKSIPCLTKGINLPSDLIAAVELELFSDVEGRVPFGAWQGLVEPLLRRWLADRKPVGATPARS